MALYCVSIGNREYKVNLNGEKGSVNGEPVEVELTPLNSHGLHMMRHSGQTVEMHFQARDPENYEVLVGARRVLARVETMQKRLRRRSEPVQTGALLAPMPGLVVSICVAVGDMVTEGQTLVVLESMKMQMQLRAAQTGVVKQIAVQPGQQVEKGSLLVKVD